jgi:hypothetical protein
MVAGTWELWLGEGSDTGENGMEDRRERKDEWKRTGARRSKN